MLDAPSLFPEVLAAIPVGTRVRLPDDSIATVTHSTLSRVEVVFPERVLGRGPWAVERWRVEEVAS